MEQLFDFLNHPAFYGFASGVLLCLGGWILGGGPRRVLKLDLRKKDEEIREREKQLDRLRDQLHTQMEINAKGSESLKKERDALAEQVKNLEINVATLQQKPGRAERRQLAIYQVALDRMFAEAPGFATAWQNALAKAEGEVGRSEQGFGGFLKGIVTRALPHGQGEDLDEEDARSQRATPSEDRGAPFPDESAEERPSRSESES